MNKNSSIEEINTSNLSDQTKFRLNEMNEIKYILTQKFEKEKK